MKVLDAVAAMCMHGETEGASVQRAVRLVLFLSLARALHCGVLLMLYVFMVQYSSFLTNTGSSAKGRVVESRYLQYEKKTKKVMESVTLGASRNGWRAHGNCSLILEDTIGDFAASRFWAQSRVSGESVISVCQSYVPPLTLRLWGPLFCQICPPALSLHTREAPE